MDGDGNSRQSPLQTSLLQNPARRRGLFSSWRIGGETAAVDPSHEGVLAHPGHFLPLDGGLVVDPRRAAPSGAPGGLAHGAGPGFPVRGPERRDGPQSRPLGLPLGAPAALAGASVLVRPALPAAARGLRGGRRRRRPAVRRERAGGPLGIGGGRRGPGRARAAGVRRGAPARRTPPGRACRRPARRARGDADRPDLGSPRRAAHLAPPPGAGGGGGPRGPARPDRHHRGPGGRPRPRRRAVRRGFPRARRAPRRVRHPRQPRRLRGVAGGPSGSGGDGDHRAGEPRGAAGAPRGALLAGRHRRSRGPAWHPGRAGHRADARGRAAGELHARAGAQPGALAGPGRARCGADAERPYALRPDRHPAAGVEPGLALPGARHGSAPAGGARSSTSIRGPTIGGSPSASARRQR